MRVFGAIFAVFIVLSLALVGSYNGLVTSNEQVDASWSQVESQYQRRFDLIPSLVNATKGYLKQEQKVFGDIAEARTRYAGSPSGSAEQVEAAGQIESALARLMVIVENYPELKSNETVQSLMDELAGTENRILVARDRYNEGVRDFNVQVKRFPRSMFATMFGFEPRAFFKSDDNASAAPTVDLEI